MFHLSEQKIFNGNLILLPASAAEGYWSRRHDKRDDMKSKETWKAATVTLASLCEMDTLSPLESPVCCFGSGF